MTRASDWPLTCPACRTPLGIPAAGDCQLGCPRCGQGYECTDGIWCFLPTARRAFFEPFLRDYTRIRIAEGRGSASADFYRSLPACESSHPLAWQWSLRWRTFDCLCGRVLADLGSGLKVLDLGAGVGWLSNRLSLLGHCPCAVELSDDGQDGLGAARHYAPRWPRLRAEFDRLPLADAIADVAIYNASLHYSTDYRVTLREALRVLRPGGRIVVLETPVYRREESGRQMLAERHADFERRYGTRSDQLPSQGFLTWAMIGQLAGELGVRWERHRPWYGWRWALRPWLARLKRRREPSTFAVLVMQVP
ncbi:MAG: methyltransferase domain-containing protein [Planctomycetota bacterium]|nr:methyltransferase domain-containing protein [Planctomycetota bacterium]